MDGVGKCLLSLDSKCDQDFALSRAHPTNRCTVRLIEIRALLVGVCYATWRLIQSSSCGWSFISVVNIRGHQRRIHSGRRSTSGVKGYCWSATQTWAQSGPSRTGNMLGISHVNEREPTLRSKRPRQMLSRNHESCLAGG